MAKDMPEQTRLCFAFILVNKPSNQDDTDKSLWRHAVPYMRFRHPDANARHWVLAVGDAQKTMLDRLSATPHSVLGEVHVYAHSSVEGSVWARLAQGDEKYRELTVADAKAYRDSGDRAQAIAARADSRTRIYFHGCHLGRSPDALRVWRDLFGGVRGFACAPTLFQLFAVGSLSMGATCLGSREPFLKRNLHNWQAVEQFIKDVEATGPLVCRHLDSDFAEKYRRLVMSELDKYLDKRYRRFLVSGETTWSEAEAQLRMRELFNQGNGVPITYLSRRPEPWRENLSEKALKNEEGAIFPWDVAQWKNHHHWEPYDPD